MAGDKYRIADTESTYFLTLTVVYWIDLFTRIRYKEIITQSLAYCSSNKGLEIFAWVIMSNHIHLICRSTHTTNLSEILRDFKKFTSKSLVKAIEEEPESRREWLLDKFSFEAHRTKRAKNYKVWQDGNHAIELGGYISLEQKLHYLHENPVRAGWVENPEDFLYSSARDYSGKTGLIHGITVLS